MDAALVGCARGFAVPSSARAAHALGAGFGHAAAVVGSEAEFLATALPFLRAGLRSGDLTVLSCSSETTELLRDATGGGGVLESEQAISLRGARGPEAVETCRRYVERAARTGSGRVRVLTEVDFGADPADRVEGRRFESVFNTLVVGAPVSALCVYDHRRLPTDVVDSAAATHPVLVQGGSEAASPAFQDPESYVRALPVHREPVEDAPPALVVDEAPTLAGLRRALRAALAASVPDLGQREDLHLAVSEIAANAFRHGVPPVSARLWADGERLVCVVADRGTSFDDPLAGFVPAHGLDLGRGGMGLWLARKLWDHVDLLSGPGGLSVRLSTRLR